MVGLLSKVSKSVEIRAALNLGEVMRYVKGDRTIRGMTIMVSKRKPYIGVYVRCRPEHFWVEIRDKERAGRFINALVKLMSTSTDNELSALEKLLFWRSQNSRVKSLDVDFLTYLEQLPNVALILKSDEFRFVERGGTGKGAYVPFVVQE